MSIEGPSRNIVYVPVEKLREMPGNPRTISAKEMEDLKRSLRTFGFSDPIIVYAGPEKEHVGEIIGGHQRWKAARALGFRKVPAILWKGPYVRARQFNVALNKVHGDWDMDKLYAFLSDLPDVDVTGFTKEEVEALMPKITAYSPKMAPVEDYVTEEEEEVSESGEKVRVRRCLCCGRPM